MPSTRHLSQPPIHPPDLVGVLEANFYRLPPNREHFLVPYSPKLCLSLPPRETARVLPGTALRNSWHSSTSSPRRRVSSRAGGPHRACHTPRTRKKTRNDVAPSGDRRKGARRAARGSARPPSLEYPSSKSRRRARLSSSLVGTRPGSRLLDLLFELTPEAPGFARAVP